MCLHKFVAVCGCVSVCVREADPESPVRLGQRESNSSKKITQLTRVKYNQREREREREREGEEKEKER